MCARATADETTSTARATIGDHAGMWQFNQSTLTDG